MFLSEYFFFLVGTGFIVLFVCTALGFKFAKITRTSEEGVLTPLNFKDISKDIAVAGAVSLLPMLVFFIYAVPYIFWIVFILSTERI